MSCGPAGRDGVIWFCNIVYVRRISKQLSEKEKLFMKSFQPLRLTTSGKRQRRNASLVQMFFPTWEKSMCKDEKKNKKLTSIIKPRKASMSRDLFRLQLLVLWNQTGLLWVFFLSIFVFCSETPKSNCKQHSGSMVGEVDGGIACHKQSIPVITYQFSSRGHCFCSPDWLFVFFFVFLFPLGYTRSS